jgi:hypothetical protein
MQVYNTEIQTSTIEMVDQMVLAIASQSRGAIQLTSIRNKGDYAKVAMWQNLAAARRRVDRTIANASQSATTLVQIENVGVKVAGGFGPVLLEPGQITWLQEDPASAIAAISRYFAEALVQDQLNTGILSAVAAIDNQSALVNDVTTAKITQTAINGSHAKFGDMSQMLVCDVMNGTTYHNLVAQGLANGNELFKAENVTIVDILGKAVVITDAPALLDLATTPDQNIVLSLVSGGLEVSDNSDLITNMETNNGQKRIETTWQADYTFNVKLKGYAWDIANGGNSPSDAALGTGSNWDPVNLPKFSAGTLARGDI